MNRDWEQILEQLDRFKLRYDKYAGSLIKLKKHVPNFIEVNHLFDHFQCHCPKDKIFISSYPVATEKFIGHILVTCGTCFGSFIPKLKINLDDYYQKDYQFDVQPFRTVVQTDGKFFDYFVKTDAYKRFSKRSLFLLEISDDKPEKKILDIGSGVGVLLKLSQSHSKYAVEPDPYSKVILTRELGVTVLNEIPDNSINLKFDTIFMSHVLEHYDPQSVDNVLMSIKNIMNSQGQLVIAVPDGANQITRLMNGSRDGILFEPHTINFSLKMMVDTLTRNGFAIKSASAPKSVDKSALYSDFFNGPITRLVSGEIVVVAQHNEHAEKM
ncbi:MAG: methyltransferase domain-containing protein [Pseudomonadota bacterium]